MALSRREIAKDVIQQSAEAAFATAGRVAAIFFDAARGITTELGSFGTEVFEIAEASRRATEDEAELDPAGVPGRGRQSGTVTRPGEA